MAKEMVPTFAFGGTQGDTNNFSASGVVGDTQGVPTSKEPVVFTSTNLLAQGYKHAKKCSIIQQRRQASVMGVCLLSFLCLIMLFHLLGFAHTAVGLIDVEQSI